MDFALTLRCDGRRDYIERTVASLKDNIATSFERKIIIDDSGDPDYAAWLDTTFPDFECIHHPQRTGLGGCFKSSLEAVLMRTDADFAFMVEDDTPLLGNIDLPDMALVLAENPLLSQLMLLRPPFNDAEIRAGGVFECRPGEFTEHANGYQVWVEHSLWYGFQPHLASRSVVAFMVHHPSDYLELGVSEPLKAAGYRFGYWGGLRDAPLCEHVGKTRSSGYRW